MILGVGLDLVDIERIERLLKRHDERFLHRVFTRAEQEAVLERRRFPAPSFAARFAAKEALYKALNTTEWIPFTDAEVTGGLGEPPSFLLYGKAKERFEQIGGQRLLLTLTHSKHTAAATVIIEGEPQNRGE